MTETTVELIFGIKAGVVWDALNKNGPSNIGDLVKATSLSRDEVYSALGWLGRENKITVERRRRAMVFSLREEDARLSSIKDTTIEDSVPREKSTNRRTVPPKKTPKKTKKARKVKAPASTPGVVKRAMDFILSEFEANRGPSTTQVSKEVGLDSRQLGRALSKLDIKSEPIRREGKVVRIYPLALKARVWELAALDEEGLQKMSEAGTREIENDREHFTVFD